MLPTLGRRESAANNAEPQRVSFATDPYDIASRLNASARVTIARPRGVI